ncbi:DUF309 domain-containing protein [Cytobacillus sp. S13-E01]|uniref:DUF309 domain-containing protein n=1 Tax=Cytobacillus sp. S13-E01 TaxID=3031326 RepID=UPI0023D7C690|nr:DUF309 domain-containing protein [Cytobacillus sp. S13-E01]MDF0726162.1 DUF309 domain-containing protein [Cytobacillus sp. S13-E01]
MYPKAYLNYLIHFHGDRDYFECHEVLEEHWKEAQRAERKLYWVGLIQLAVGLYHQRRGNFKGAYRMMNNAIDIIKKERDSLTKLGLDYEELLSIVLKRVNEIQNQVPYKSFTLPISDKKLLSTCIESCETKGLTWGIDSDITDHYLVNKHMLRDRSEVINERERQKRLKERDI